MHLTPVLPNAKQGFFYGLEAVKLLCEYIFSHTDIIRIYAEPFAHNIGSQRVLEKAGFQYEGTLRANAVKNGEAVDMKMYAKLKTYR